MVQNEAKNFPIYNKP